MSDRVWYLYRGSSPFGPYTWDEVVQLARSGHVDPLDQVRREGEPIGRTAKDIPGLLAQRVPPNRRLYAALGAGAVLLAGTLVVIAVTRGGSDKSASDTSTGRRTTTARSTTTTPSSAATTLEPATSTNSTTSPPYTTVASTVATTPPTTAAPETTTTLAVATTGDLVDALPAGATLPDGWTPTSDAVDTALVPRSGPFHGLCGGDNADARAQQYGVVAYAGSHAYVDGTGATFYVTLYAFPQPGDATAYMAATREQLSMCPDGVSADFVEGDGEDEIDLFSEGYGDGQAVWHAEGWYTEEPSVAGPADEAIRYTWDATFATDYQNHPASVHDRDLMSIERYGSIVVALDLYGAFDLTGFANAEELTDYVPTPEVFEATAGVFRPAVIAVLQRLSLIV